MLLKNASVLYGKDLTYVSSADLKISNQKFKKIKPCLQPSSDEEINDCEGLLIIPGFVNCHTHIGDSIAKDIILNKKVDDKIHPVIGIKSKILKKTEPSILINFMKNTCSTMLIAAPLTITKTWKQPNIHQQRIKKIRYIFTIGYYSTIKKRMK